MSVLSAHFHCHGPNEHERGTAVTVEAQSDCVTVRLGIGGQLPVLTIYVPRAAEAFALAQAFASAGEVLERREAVSRRNEIAAEPWSDVPLPLDAPTPESLFTLRGWFPSVPLPLGDDQADDLVQLCRCGKPAVHVLAAPDSDQWACRVPLVEAAWPPAARIDLDGGCSQGTSDKCAELGCADERCPSF